MASLGVTLVDGTQYTITGGVTLNGGTQYAITGGVTLNGGTQYSIGDESGGNVTVTVTNGFSATSSSGFNDLLGKGYVTYGTNATKYISSSFTVPAGTNIMIYRKRGPKAEAGAGGIVTSYDVAYQYYEGTTLKSTSTYTSSTTAITNTITVTTDTKINFLYKTVSSSVGGGGLPTS